MYDFISDHPLYAVMVIVLICWAGIFSYLVKLQRHIANLMRQKGE